MHRIINLLETLPGVGFNAAAVEKIKELYQSIECAEIKISRKESYRLTVTRVSPKKAASGLNSALSSVQFAVSIKETSEIPVSNFVSRQITISFGPRTSARSARRQIKAILKR